MRTLILMGVLGFVLGSALVAGAVLWVKDTPVVTANTRTPPVPVVVMAVPEPAEMQDFPVPGQVVAAEPIPLLLPGGGRVAQIKVKPGSVLRKGEVVAILDNGVQQAALGEETDPAVDAGSLEADLDDAGMLPTGEAHQTRLGQEQETTGDRTVVRKTMETTGSAPMADTLAGADMGTSPTENDVTAAAQAEPAPVETWTAQIQGRRVCMPRSGRLVAILATPGQTLSDQAPLAHMAPPDPTRVTLKAPNTLLERLLPGQTARLYPAAERTATLPHYPVTIKTLTPAESRSVGTALLDMHQVPPGVVTLGSPVLVVFSLPGKGALWVPRRAVRLVGTEGVVYVLQEQGARTWVNRRRVIVGDVREDQVEIVSGLSSGESLVVEGNRFLQHNQAVTVVHR